MKIFTVGDMLAALEKGIKDLRDGQYDSVRFDFGGYVPTQLSTYRGNYDQCALNYTSEGEISIHDLYAKLSSQLGCHLYGWKGGEYKVHEGRILWAAENDGVCPSTAIVGFRYIDAHFVIDTAYLPFDEVTE